MEFIKELKGNKIFKTKDKFGIRFLVIENGNEAKTEYAWCDVKTLKQAEKEINNL